MESSEGSVFILPSNFHILSMEANETSKAPSVILETINERSIKLNNSFETLTGFIPAFLFIKDIQLGDIDCSEKEKVRFIETLLNLTIISLENKKLFRKVKTEVNSEDLGQSGTAWHCSSCSCFTHWLCKPILCRKSGHRSFAILCW